MSLTAMTVFRGLIALVPVSSVVTIGAEQTGAYSELAAAGTYHDPGGLIEFPAEFEGWKRGSILRYEQSPGGVSIEYELLRQGSVEHKGVATAYVYARRSAVSAEAHVEETVDALLAAHPTFELVSSEPAEFGRSRTVVSGWMATLIDRGGLMGFPAPGVSYVVVSAQGDHWLKWRITHSARDVDVPEAADRLIGSLVPTHRTE